MYSIPLESGMQWNESMCIRTFENKNMCLMNVKFSMAPLVVSKCVPFLVLQMRTGPHQRMFDQQYNLDSLRAVFKIPTS